MSVTYCKQTHLKNPTHLAFFLLFFPRSLWPRMRLWSSLTTAMQSARPVIFAKSPPLMFLSKCEMNCMRTSHAPSSVRSYNTVSNFTVIITNCNLLPTSALRSSRIGCQQVQWTAEPKWQEGYLQHYHSLLLYWPALTLPQKAWRWSPYPASWQNLVRACSRGGEPFQAKPNLLHNESW